MSTTPIVENNDGDDSYESANEEFECESSIQEPGHPGQNGEASLIDDTTTSRRHVLNTSASSWLGSVWQTASTTVTNISGSVGDGLSVVMKAIDSGLGAPDPSKLATAMHRLETSETPKDNATAECQSVDQVVTERSTAPIDPVYIQRITKLIEKFRISNAFSSGLEALENVGRATAGSIRETHLHSALKSGFLEKYLQIDHSDVANTLSRLASQNSKDWQKCEGTAGDPAISNNSKDDLSRLIELSNTANSNLRKLHSDDVNSLRLRLALDSCEGSANSSWSEYYEVLEKQWDDFDKRFNLSTTDVMLSVKTIEADYAKASDCDFDIDQILHIYDKSIEQIQTITCTLFKTIAEIKFNDLCDLEYVQRLSSTIYESISICTESYVNLIRNRWPGDRDDVKFRDAVAALFLKASDSESFILEAYEHLQKCMIANATHLCSKSKEELAEPVQ